LRVGIAGTFAAIHSLVKRLIREGRLQGCGWINRWFADPVQYFQRLRLDLIRDARRGDAGPFYMVIKKILRRSMKKAACL